LETALINQSAKPANDRHSDSLRTLLPKTFAAFIEEEKQCQKGTAG